MSEPVDPFAGARLTICIDFKNPYAYLANEPTWSLLNELRAQARWLPFDASPLQPPRTAADRDDRGARHRIRRAAYHDEELRRYARARGIDLGDRVYGNPDTTAAAIALLLVNDTARAMQERFITSVYDGYWCGGLDLNDATALRTLWIEAGGDARSFDSFGAGPGVAQHADVRARLAAAGVFSVPAYAIDGEVFYGRAHLPMVRWLLLGKEGPGPL